MAIQNYPLIVLPTC